MTIRSKFRKQHYELIACTLAASRPILIIDHGGLAHYRLATWSTIVHNLADLFKRDNTKFDRSKFTEACQQKTGIGDTE